MPGAIEANLSRMVGVGGLSHSLFESLVRVAAAPATSNAAYQSLTTSSLADFLDFWTRVKTVATEPEVSVAPDGSLAAEWYKSGRQKLDARFVDRKVIYGLFANTSIHEGADRVEVVAEFLKNHPAHPLQWAAK
jgi:hypothetical protein